MFGIALMVEVLGGAFLSILVFYAILNFSNK
jgi:hypothetical protein